MARFRARFWDPTGARYGTPTYPWRAAPDGLMTRRQLRAEGLRPGGQDPVAQILWQNARGLRVAYLYRVDRACPVRPMTEGRYRALAAAMRARRTCPTCRIDRGYVISVRLGACVPCADTENRPAFLNPMGAAMTGAEHYVEAERLLEFVSSGDAHPGHAGVAYAHAQVHATLALAAAQAAQITGLYVDSDTYNAWRDAIGDHESNPYR